MISQRYGELCTDHRMTKLMISYQGQEHVQEEPPSGMSGVDKGLTPDFRLLLSRAEGEYTVMVLRP